VSVSRDDPQKAALEKNLGGRVAREAFREKWRVSRGQKPYLITWSIEGRHLDHRFWCIVG
jgi:hypothetical protein